MFLFHVSVIYCYTVMYVHLRTSELWCLNTQDPVNISHIQMIFLSLCVYVRLIEHWMGLADDFLSNTVIHIMSRSIHNIWLLIKFEKILWKQLRIYCAFSVFILFWKILYLQTKRLGWEKCRLYCSLAQITSFHSKFVFLCITWIS